MGHSYRKYLKRFIRKTFSFWQRMGVHIVHNDYHSPVPDTQYLKHYLWPKRESIAGIDFNEELQLKLLSLFESEYKNEYETFPREKTEIDHQYYVNNRQFESVDGEILYCMIRHFKPRTIIEIGCGNSTYLAAQAILENTAADSGLACELLAIEPYPNELLKKGFPGLSGLIDKKVQDVPLSEFMRLGERDILFIDSSHVLKTGSDVQYEFLEIIPRLKRGVIVHVHDIFLPSEYPRECVLERMEFWTEQYLLQAFLSFNDSFEVLWAGSYMHLIHPDLLEAAFASYTRDARRPGSFWMRRIN